MDTLKLLFYTALAALVAALGVSWKDFKKARAEEDPKKVYEISRQIAEIHKDQEKMQAERDRILGKEAPKIAAPPAAREEAGPTPSEVDLAAIDAASSLSNPDAALPSEGLVPAPPPAAPVPQDRGRMISEAAAVAKIIEWVEDPQYGTICGMEVKDPAAVKIGSILAIRRNGGIIGRVKVGEVTPEGAVGNPSGILEDLKPQVGDELIVAPAD